jgi:ABC-type multidrug transport system ATPase subunit
MFLLSAILTSALGIGLAEKTLSAHRIVQAAEQEGARFPRGNPQAPTRTLGSMVERTPDSTVFLASHDLSEIESFASHIAHIDEGRLRFVEELGPLVERFREIEIVLEQPSGLPADLPASWLSPEQPSVMVRFIHSAYDAQAEAEIRRRFSGIREIAVRNASLRTIFIALAKLAKKNHEGI